MKSDKWEYGMTPDEVFDIWYRRQRSSFRNSLRKLFEQWNLESGDFDEDELDCNLTEYSRSQVKNWVLPHILACYNTLHNKPNTSYEEIIDNVKVWEQKETMKVYHEIDN